MVLFLPSCSQNPSLNRWQISKYDATEEQYSFTRATYSTSKTSSGLEVELIFDKYGEEDIYLNVFSIPLPYDTENPSICPILIIINGEKTSVLAHRLEGGQRLLLPKEAQTVIKSAMEEGCDIEIVAGRYKGTVKAEGFCSY